VAIPWLLFVFVSDIGRPDAELPARRHQIIPVLDIDTVIMLSCSLCCM